MLLLAILLSAPADAAPDEVVEPIEAWLAEDQPARDAHAHDLGVVAQLGGWWRDLSHEPVCTITLLVPDGLDVDGVPSLALGDSGLHVDVALTRGTGGLREYELGRCLPASTPVLVHLQR